MTENILTPELINKIVQIESELSDKKGAVEIPDSDGLVLVKIGTPEYKARKNSPMIMMYTVNHELVVCTG